MNASKSIKSSVSETFFKLTAELSEKLLNIDLTAAEWRIWCYLVSLDPLGDVADTQSGRAIKYDVDELMTKCRVKKSTYFTAKAKFLKLGLLPEWFEVREVKRIEKQIRERLQANLSGLSEISTPVGRIDLLTDTEIIEVKRFGDWKAALGQILIYSAFYPEHQKRIHLFGSKAELEKLLDIELACLGFAVKVTGEEV